MAEIFGPAIRIPAAAIVNEAFAKRYFNGENPVGRSFEKAEGDGRRASLEIVGLVRDARYRNLREPITPTAYVPFRSIDSTGEEQPRSSGHVHRSHFQIQTRSRSLHSCGGKCLGLGPNSA